MDTARQPFIPFTVLVIADEDTDPIPEKSEYKSYFTTNSTNTT